ncbi:hypothetical protein M5689_015591 [Euphorbia peplus]|nr:hypothetical protein M5689_015591 [Euphorbia peplus]
MLHQPGYTHERVVVEGYGHLDLLIGEKSHEEVFPHILSHIRRAELEGNGIASFERKRYSKEVLDWRADPYGGGHGGFGSCISFIFVLCLFCFILCVSIDI